VVSLQERDFLILKWILEMRFSNLEMVNEGFFSDKSVSMATARSRISQLVQGNYLLKTQGYDSTTKAYYLATKKAHKVLETRDLDGVLVKPIKALSVHSFEHDRCVSLIRIKLEQEGRAKKWKSERVLKAELAMRSIKISREIMPDAIFESRIGHKCAFELELSPKSLKRYYQKVERFSEIMEEKDGLFKLCLFVTCNEFTFKTLTELTKPYGNKFRVQKFGEIIKDV
jgi:hypothetical protein